MNSEGWIYQRGNRWWIAYYYNGKKFRESGGKTEREAKSKLKLRMKEMYGDRFVGPKLERATVVQLLDDLERYLENRGAKAMKSLKSHLKPVRAFFALTRAVDLTASRVEEYRQVRLTLKEDAKAPATVNREIGALKQALNLARKQGRLARVPYISMPKESNARQGFFERADFEAVVASLPDPLNDIARFAYLSGWRRGEIVPLRWEAVDRAAKEVRLHTSKNGQGRVLPMMGALSELIERRWAMREYVKKDGTTGLSDLVFHHNGKPVVDFRKAWAKACKTAEVPDRLFHDLRRTAVRDMVRAGVPQSVAMTVSGHRTVSIFLRYNITSGDDMRDAIRRTQEYRSTQPSGRNVSKFPSEGTSR